MPPRESMIRDDSRSSQRISSPGPARVRFGPSSITPASPATASASTRCPCGRRWSLKLNTVPLNAPHKRLRFLEHVNYFGQTGEIDAQGRVLVHQRLRESTAMTGTRLSLPAPVPELAARVPRAPTPYPAQAHTFGSGTHIACLTPIYARLSAARVASARAPGGDDVGGGLARAAQGRALARQHRHEVGAALLGGGAAHVGHEARLRSPAERAGACFDERVDQAIAHPARGPAVIASVTTRRSPGVSGSEPERASTAPLSRAGRKRVPRERPGRRREHRDDAAPVHDPARGDDGRPARGRPRPADERERADERGRRGTVGSADAEGAAMAARLPALRDHDVGAARDRARGLGDGRPERQQVGTGRERPLGP